ncbi:MAG: RnfABCDGE type electron transport complex subunit A [Candidatus Omnitrophota bacterium]|jgi:electron transport complex protein RnfA
MDISIFLSVIIGAIFINNFILSKFLGLCSFIGISKETKPALYMGISVTFVITCASMITWVIYRFILVPYHIEYLRTISFILVIASFVQFVEIVIKRFSHALYKTLGIYLPLITVNCAVLGAAVLNSEMFFKPGVSTLASFTLSALQGFCVGIGYILVMLFMSGIRERLELCDIPASFKNAPIAFIIASLMSMAFMGFAGFRF